MDVTNSIIKSRKERIEKTNKILQDLMPIGYEKAIATISFNVGVTPSKAKEYIKILIELNDWIVKDEIIKLKPLNP
jgi:hypothetical protein